MGDGPSAHELKDDWGNPIVPYNLDAGPHQVRRLRGGHLPRVHDRPERHADAVVRGRARRPERSRGISRTSSRASAQPVSRAPAAETMSARPKSAKPRHGHDDIHRVRVLRHRGAARHRPGVAHGGDRRAAVWMVYYLVRFWSSSRRSPDGPALVAPAEAKRTWRRSGRPGTGHAVPAVGRVLAGVRADHRRDPVHQVQLRGLSRRRCRG